jgi:hypothetical protein
MLAGAVAGRRPAGLVRRRSVPARIPHKTPADRVAATCALRRVRMTAADIADCLRMPVSTVSPMQLREVLGKRARLAAAEPPSATRGSSGFRRSRG